MIQEKRASQSAVRARSNADALRRALIVSPSPVDAQRMASELCRGGAPVDFERVEDRRAMQRALDGGAWDLVLCDGAASSFGATDALALLRASKLDPAFVVVGEACDEALAEEAMRAGASDFVPRERLAGLASVVRRALRHHEERAARRCAEAGWRASERWLRSFFEATHDGVWMVDPDGITTFVNARMGRLLGCDAKSLVGRTPLEFVSEAHRPLFVRDQPELRAGVTCRREVLFVRVDGASVWTELEATPLFDESGRYEGAIAVVVDISERKRAESALRSTEEQLRQAQKMEAVGRLAGGVAHDFNNLLSVILGTSDLMLSGMEPGEPLREDLEEIRTAGLRAADLTRQLLLFSRQQVVEPRVLDLNDTLRSVDKMLRRLVGEDVEVICRAGLSLGQVFADVGSIEQVVMNLAVNARDAMPDGGTLTIETRNVALDADFARAHVGVRPGPYVMFEVRDTGVGMDEATQARIFEPFFTTKGLGKGTGLGLSTVFGIVQQSGGSVWVQSAPGEGSSFEVYLPRIDARAEAPGSLAPAGLARGTETVLLVEDEDQVRMIVSSVLKRRGYTVIEARNAGEALMMCEQHPEPIDLMLSDVVMPRMSGPELARRVGPTRPAMKVLFMSGYTNDSALLQGVMASSVAFLQKPITVETLSRKVREALDG